MQPFIGVALVDVDDLIARLPHHRWGASLLDRLPEALNAPNRPDTGQSGIQLCLNVVDFVEGKSLHIAHPAPLDRGQEVRVVGHATTCHHEGGEHDGEHGASTTHMNVYRKSDSRS